MILNSSTTNQNLISLSMDTFRIYGRAIADILDDKSNDLTDDEKIFWINELTEVVRILGFYVEKAKTILETQDADNIICYSDNARWN